MSNLLRINRWATTAVLTCCACTGSPPNNATTGGGSATTTLGSGGSGGSSTGGSSAGGGGAGGVSMDGGVDAASPDAGAGPTGHLIGFADFNTGGTTPASIFPDATWYSFGKGVRIENGALAIDYPAGEAYPGVGINIPLLKTREVYVELKARMPPPRGGFKFAKFFLVNNGAGYANTTFGLDYTGIPDGKGSLYYIAFGDGSAPENDTANGVWLDGKNPAGVGRSYPKTAVVETPQNRNFKAADWGTSWHDFKMKLKFNGGTSAQKEVADGECYLEIDGVVFARASGLFNRYWSNSEAIDRVEFAGWSQSNDGPFTVYYDDIRVSLDGFCSTCP